jgi:hypothetical protein
VFILLVWLSSPALMNGAEVTTYQMYTDQELASVASHYRDVIAEMLSSKRLGQFLSEEEQIRLANLSREFPMRGAHPFDFSSDWTEARKVIRTPVLSLKFIEDLMIAYAYRYRRDHSEHSFDDFDVYVTRLAHSRADSFADGRYPAPLTALGIPKGILEEDKEVADLSLSFRNEAWCFVVAHELGHLYNRHRVTKQASMSQTNESQADVFALDLMDRAHTIPLGAFFWFQCSVCFFGSGADFKTKDEYRHWLENETTHPANSARVEQLGFSLMRRAERSRQRSSQEFTQLDFIGRGLTNIAEVMSDPEMHRHIVSLGMRPISQGQLDDINQGYGARRLSKTTVGRDTNEGRKVVINDRLLTNAQVEALERRLGMQIENGEYWYDESTGAYGRSGTPTIGFVEAGIPNLGRLAENASNGRTGVLVNGRRLPQDDLVALQQYVGKAILPGSYWLLANGIYGVIDNAGNRVLRGKIGAGFRSTKRGNSPLSTYDRAGAAVIGRDVLTKP